MAIGARRMGSVRRQHGSVAVLVGLLLLVLTGMAAFAIDLARWMVVRSELQNGADAAALAGAGHLFPPLDDRPNWAHADTQAHAAVPLNMSEKIVFDKGVVTTGWWDFQSRTFDVHTGKTPSAAELPAVRVTLARQAGHNGGPILTTFGRLFGLDSIAVQASATAVVSVPASVGPGVLAPFAISQCLLQAATGYWDPVRQRPVGSPPPVFVIASGAVAAAHCNGCNCGQWTTFNSTSNAASVTQALVRDGNPQPLKAGEGTFIQTGMKSSDYGAVALHLNGKDIAVPVVDGTALDTKGSTPVLRFACLRVVAGIQGGNANRVCSEYPLGTPIPGGGIPNENKCVIARFVSEPCKVAAGDGTSGPFTGTYIPPRLVQ